jgi:hypothetical protein
VAIYYKIPRWELKNRTMSELIEAYKDILYDVSKTKKAQKESEDGTDI